MVDVYELLSLFGKRVASLKLTSSWSSSVLYIVTAANSCPQVVYELMANVYGSLSPNP